jgi:hypothetical protein
MNNDDKDKEHMFPLVEAVTKSHHHHGNRTHMHLLKGDYKDNVLYTTKDLH